jgi:LCP family protein required for cell wall assembly
MKRHKEPGKEINAFIRYFGIIMAVIEIIAAGTFIGMVFWIDLLTAKIEMIMILLIVILSLICLITQLIRVRGLHWIGKVLSLLMTIVLIIGSIYVVQAKNTVNAVTNNTTKTDVVSIYVLKDDPAESINDAAGYTFGYVNNLDQDNTIKCINQIEEKTGTTITTKTFDSVNDLVASLYNKELGAIILNQSYTSTLEQMYANFDEDTRILDYATYVKEIQEVSVEKNKLPNTITLYLSGNDQAGALNQAGRSDVNILIVINPQSKQILLVNTPRDYYVNVNSLTSGIGKDKLTHAGNFGVDASMATLSNLYHNWPVDYYFRVNFTSVEKIVDALGGITVNSDIAFTTQNGSYGGKSYTYKVGPNQMNGEQALGFCRERYVFSNGDNQRGKNQMAVLSGIVDKVASPAILYNYSSILNSVSSFFQTNLLDDDIEQLVKMTMDSKTPWKVQSYAVSGLGTYAQSYFFPGSALYMMEPNMNTVDTAVQLMTKIKNGEVFDVKSYTGEK